MDEFDVADDARRFDDQIADRDAIQRALQGIPEDFRAALVLREYAVHIRRNRPAPGDPGADGEVEAEPGTCRGKGRAYRLLSA